MYKDDIILKLIRLEGGYVKDKLDSGGETNFGITKEIAREQGFLAPMNSMTESEAYHIYSVKYWDRLKLDEISLHSKDIAEKMFDIGVNLGITRAGKFLQRSLNVLNRNEELYEDILVDGKVGYKTIKAFQKYITRRKPIVLYRMLNSLQGTFYIELAERRKKDERFIYGWFLNRIQ